MLNKRQITLLQMMKQIEGYQTIHSLASSLQVSYKTITNDIHVIVPWLNKLGIVLKSTPHKGVQLLLDDQLHISLDQELMNLKVVDQTGSRERRIELMLTFLWKSNTYFSMQAFANQYYVSITSIVKDIEYISKELSTYNIHLQKSNKGTKSVGYESDYRSALLDHMEHYTSIHIMDKQRYQNLHEIYQGICKEKLPSLEELILFLSEAIKDIEVTLHKVVNEPYYTNALFYMAFMILRMKQGYTIASMDELHHCEDEMDEEGYSFILHFVEKIEKQYDITMGLSERTMMYRQLISGGLSKKEIEVVEKNTKENNLNSLTLAYTRYLIEHMSVLFGIDFQSQVYLHSNLRFHIKPMLNRLRYGIKVRSVLLEEMKRRYPLEFLLTRISCILTSKRYELQEPSEEETAYIMVYFQSAIERRLQSIQALLVSQNSMGSAQLLKTRLENNFPDLRVKDVIPPTKLNDMNMEDIDVIFLTGDVSINLPYLQVTPFLDTIEIQMIERQLRRLRTQTIRKYQKIDVPVIEKKVRKGSEGIEVSFYPTCQIRLVKQEASCLYHWREDAKIYFEVQYVDLREISNIITSIIELVFPIK